jgi:hypothetical protein
VQGRRPCVGEGDEFGPESDENLLKCVFQFKRFWRRLEGRNRMGGPSGCTSDCVTRDLATMIRHTHKRRRVDRVRLVCDLTGRVQVSDFVCLLRGARGIVFPLELTVFVEDIHRFLANVEDPFLIVTLFLGIFAFDLLIDRTDVCVRTFRTRLDIFRDGFRVHECEYVFCSSGARLL